jgi:hypothetical protein
MQKPALPGADPQMDGEAVKPEHAHVPGFGDFHPPPRQKRPHLPHEPFRFRKIIGIGVVA